MKPTPCGSLSERTNRILSVLCAFAASLIGVWILTISMRHSVGIGGDAVIYLESARNFLAGRGMGLIQPDGSFRLIPYFPPFYPFVLSLFLRFGVDDLTAAKAINLSGAGLTIFLLSLTAAHGTKRFYAGFYLGLLLAGSPILIPGSSWAMSEVLANTLAVIALIEVVRAAADRDRLRTVPFLFSALCAGLSALTRYSMLSVAATGAVLILVLMRTPWLKRFGYAVGYGVIGVLPLGAWMAYDHAMTATTASRSAQTGTNLMRELLRYLHQLDTIVRGWFFPDSWLESGRFSFISGWIFPLIGGIVLTALTAALIKRFVPGKENDEPVSALVLAPTVFTLIYTVLIGAVSILTYPPITIGQRMLLPAYLAVMTLLAILFGADWADSEKKGIRFALLTIAALGLGGFLGLRGVRIARQNAIAGFAFDAPAWRESETIAELRTWVNDDPVIVTNEETALRFYLERPVWQLREIYANANDPLPLPYADADAIGDDPARAALHEKGALLVLFDSFEDELVDLYGTNGKAIAEALTSGMTLLFDGDDGKIWTMK